MKTIVKQSVFAVMQSSGANTPEMSDAIWGCPMTHTPIATLRLEVAWPHSPKRHGSRNLCGNKTTAVLALTAVLLGTVGTFAATTYFCGLLIERVQHLQQHYFEPRAQYSDVSNWQRRR